MNVTVRAIVAGLVVAAGLSVTGLGCSSGDEQPQGATASEEGLTGGCRLVCPKCHPGEVCPMIACYEDCNAPPPRCVETMLCPIGYTWSARACSCIASPR